jgi:PPP family 3-phenylpropionic acid transporter
MTDLWLRIREVFKNFLGYADAYPVRALYIFAYGGFTIINSFLVVILRREDFSGKQIAFICMVIPLMAFLTQPLWGVLADRFGRRRCLRIAMFFCAAVCLRLYWVHGFWIFLFTATLLAFFFTPLAPLLDSVALDFVEVKRKLSNSMFRLWGAIAAGAGTAGAGYLIEGHATRTAFLWSAAVFVAGVLFCRSTTGAAPKRTLEKITMKGLGSVLRNSRLLSFLFIVLVLAMSSTAWWNFLGVYYNDIGGSSSLFGLAIALDCMGEIPFYFLANRIIKRFGLRNVLLFTFTCSTLRLFAYSFIRNPKIALLIEPSNGVSWTLFWVAAVEHVNKIVSPEWRATGQALQYAFCFGAGTLLGLLWNGLALDYFALHFSNSWVPFAIQKVCLLSGLMLATVTGVSALVFRREGQRVPAEATSVADADQQAA